MFGTIKNATGIVAVFSFLSTLGLVAIGILYQLFTFGTINSQITTVINYIYDIIFSSLNILGFFIRPNTIKLVGLCFTSYYLLLLNFKFAMVCIRLAHHLYERILSFSGKLIGFFIKLFNLGIIAS